MAKVNIIYKNIDELVPYENNPRINDEAIDAVANSIREFGFKNPIIIDENNVIVAGHTRRLSAKKLGITEVPCIVVSDLTEEQIRAFRIADNKTNELASWDLDKLREELDSISLDMTEFGFEELEKKLDEIEEDNFDEEEAVPEVPFSKKGDIYLLGKHRLICGDSTDKETIDKLVDGNRIDLIFTDPPYNVAYEDSDGRTIQNDDMEDEDFYNFLLKAFKNLYEVIKPGGVFYCFHADSEGLNFRKAVKEAGFKLSECLIWAKNTFTLGRSDYQWQHEPILYSWKEGEAHYFIDDRSQGTVWEYNKPSVNTLHSNQKPVELVARAIQNSSRIGENVIDIFGGSGTTLIASDELDRRAFLVELDEKYVDVIVKRYISYKGASDDVFLIRDGVKTPYKDLEIERKEIV